MKKLGELKAIDATPMWGQPDVAGAAEESITVIEETISTLGDLSTIELSGRRQDVLRGDGTFGLNDPRTSFLTRMKQRRSVITNLKRKAIF
jgi:hypothetical protein